MLFAAERISPERTALEYAKEIFDVVCGEASRVHVFASAVVYRLMIAKLRGPCPRLETWGLGKRFVYQLTPMTHGLRNQLTFVMYINRKIYLDSVTLPE